MDAISPRRPVLGRLALLVSLLAIVAVLAACGGDDDGSGGGGGGGGGGTSATSFCDEVKSILTGQNGGAQEFQNAIDKLQKVHPPEDISADWKTVMDAWDAKDASEVDLQATQKAGTKVQTFIREECGLSGQN
jgi:ABC-type glycerol-3-phosphate transport system substrate-binding protein